MPNYVTIRRWALKPPADEDTLLSFVSSELVPAWRKIPGCLSLNLLALRDRSAYLAVTYWESKEACDAWGASGGGSWREEHRAILERWLELMSFQDEMDADLLVVG
jgi:heme-degrading monooxygenase HmoA